MTFQPARQRGAVTVVAALFIITTLLLMVQVLHRMAGSDILDTAVHNDAVETLFIAETGVEAASFLFANGAPGSECIDLAGVTSNAGRGSYTVTAATPVGSDCQVRVSGTIAGLGVQRVVQVVLRNDGGNLLADANADFDDPNNPCPPATCTPTGWTLDAWDDTGGPDSSRAAHAAKPNNGPGSITTAGSFGLTPFTVNAPTTLTLEFDYKVAASGGGGSVKARMRFSLSDGTNTFTIPSPVEETGNTGGFVSDSVIISIGGTGPVTITALSFELEARPGQPKWIWLDNLMLRDPGGAGNVTLRQWTEVISN